MKFVLVSPKNKTVYNFRGDLIKDIIAQGYEVIVTGPDDSYIDQIQELGCEFRLIPLNKNGLNIVNDLKYFFALKKIFTLEKPDVVLSYTVKPVVYGSVAAKLAKVKNINAMITGAGYIFISQTFKAKVLRCIVGFLYKIGLSCANTVIFQNPDDKNQFITQGFVDGSKCHVVNGSGVNMEKFKRAPLPDKLTFLMVSRIMYNKGVREYLEAARIVKQKYEDVRFMLVGAIENTQDSMSIDELQPYIDDGTVEYFGETDDIISYYKQCSVYVLPSYSEGLPRTVIEAMAMGRPIITTDAPGCRETVVDGKNGFLVLVRDIDALINKIESFVLNKSYVESMGAYSLDLCRSKFDSVIVNKNMIKYLGL